MRCIPVMQGTHLPLTFLLCIPLLLICCKNEVRSEITIQQKIIEDSMRNYTHQKQYEQLLLKADTAFKFCKKNNYNEEFCILINMGKHSGEKRFFVWDFAKQKAIDSGLVSHGCCDNLWGNDASREEPVFSNMPETHCSSLGKYKVGIRGISNWGIKVNYLLHGLDKTNSNALSRSIVMHSWDVIDDEEIYPSGTQEGWGCPAVSNKFMERIDKRLQDSKKPVLLWIFI